MESIENVNDSSEELKLQRFRSDIEIFAKSEEEKGSVQLVGLSVQDLTLEDMQMWEMLNAFKQGDDADQLVDTFRQYRSKVRPLKNNSRDKFCSMIANKVTAISSPPELLPPNFS
jgi:hypothetical protein